MMGPLDWTLQKLRKEDHVEGEVTQVRFRLLDVHIHINQVRDGLKRVVRYADGDDCAEQAIMLDHLEMGKVLCEEQDSKARDRARTQYCSALYMIFRPSKRQAPQIADQIGRASCRER